MALGVPKETSNKELEEVEGAVAPLVAATAGIVKDRLLLIGEYPKEENVPAGPSASSWPTQGLGYKTCYYNYGVSIPLRTIVTLRDCPPIKSSTLRSVRLGGERPRRLFPPFWASWLSVVSSISLGHARVALGC